MKSDPNTHAEERPEVDLLVSHAEVNQHHGVGIFIRRLFGAGRGFACLRSTTMYGCEETFGDHHIALHSRSLTTPEIAVRLEALLGGFRVRRILAVPYFREDFIHALLAKRLTGAPLCTFIMDDQNVFAPHVSDHCVAALLAESDVRLGISREMCVAYEYKFGHRFHLMPPAVESTVDVVPCYWQPETGEPLRCAMIGNVWSAHRFCQLRAVGRATGIQIDWYGSGPKASWLDGKFDEWEQDGIRCLGFLAEEDLIAALASYPFVLIPSGTADEHDDNPSFSRLSLPSRVVFLHARIDTPVLVLGSKHTAVGHFVSRLGTGLCAPPVAGIFTTQVKRLLRPYRHQRMRRRIRNLARHLALPNGGAWIWETLANRAPRPAGFDALFPPPSRWRRRTILKGIQPFTPGSDTCAEDSNDPRSFGFSRNSHIPVLTRKRLLPDIAPEDLEVTEFLRAATFHVVREALPVDSNILFIGDTLPEIVHRTEHRLRFWYVSNFCDWRSLSESSPAATIVPLAIPPGPSTRLPKTPDRFAAVWSAGGLDTVPHAPDSFARFSSLCEAWTAPDGLNVHAFTAVLHRDYQWIHPLHAHLRKRFLARVSWPDWDEVLASPDTYFMSRPCYEKCWMPHTKKSYDDFGRVLWVCLTWKQPK